MNDLSNEFIGHPGLGKLAHYSIGGVGSTGDLWDRMVVGNSGLG